MNARPSPEDDQGRRKNDDSGWYLSINARAAEAAPGADAPIGAGSIELGADTLLASMSSSPERRERIERLTWASLGDHRVAVEGLAR